MNETGKNKYVDPNPFSDYGRGTASNTDNPMAVEWQDANRAAMDVAMKPETLAAFADNAQAATSLLAAVKPAYATDPLKATQIAAVSQMVMAGDMSSRRNVWTDALLKAAEAANDDSVTVFMLDQLRWCGYPCQKDAVLSLAARRSEHVRSMAALVAAELSRAR